MGIGTRKSEPVVTGYGSPERVVEPTGIEPATS